MTGKEKLEKIDQYIEKLDKRYGMYGIVNSDVVEYLNMTRPEIHALTVQECSEISYMLTTYSFFLKKQENRCLALVNQLQNELNKIVFKEIKNYNNYTYMKLEEKVYTVCNGNDYAQSLQNELEKIQFEKDYLQFLSVGVKNIADIITEVKRSKYERQGITPKSD